MASMKREDDIAEVFQAIASTNCDELIDVLADKELDSCIGNYRTAFISYIDAFQNSFRLAVERRFDTHQIEQDLEPWHTNYVTLKPFSPAEEHGHAGKSSSLVAKAHKITRKACVLFNNEVHHDDHHHTNSKSLVSE